MKRSLTTLTLITTLVTLVGCNSSVDTLDNTDNSAVIAEHNAVAESSIASDSDDTATEVITDIDWSKVDSGEPAADRANYDYPFTLDSQNVQDYADYFKVDNATAQYNLTIGMASNEALSKVLDQLESTYTSHQLTDGEGSKLIIHTTPEVTASEYEYVFAEPFAKGLTIPIEIKPDGVKGDVDVNPHEKSL